VSHSSWRRLGAAIGMTLAIAPAAARDDAEARILGAALRDDRAHRRLAWLTDRIGPRLSGSENLTRAIVWAEEQMRGDGLERVRTEPVAVPHWERGREIGEIVSPTRHPLALLTLGGSVATAENGVQASVVVADDLEHLARLGESVRGKIVLFDKEILRNGGPDGSRGYGSAAALRTRGASEAARLGAVASLVRSLGTADYRLPHTGAMRYEDGVPRIPSAAIAAEDAELIRRLTTAGQDVQVSLTLTPTTHPDAESANVVGELRGRERPEEIVVLACHLDSWDVGTGAIDDGVGCVAVMEALRILRELELRPRRTIRAVLFTNEENGLAGAEDYARRHADELASHVAAIEMDSGAGAPLGFGITAGEGAEVALREMAAPLRALGAGEIRKGGGGADISTLAPAGVPQIGLWQDTTTYFDYHHTHADTLDKVDAGALARSVAALALIGYRLAEAETTLPRIPSKAEGAGN